MIDVALIGTGGMMPLPRRWLASAQIRSNGRILQVDCGEGTQIAARSNGFGFKEIDAFLLTHFHADHVAGLPGMLFMLAQSDRTEPVIIAGPPGLERVLRGLLTIVGRLPYELQLMELRGGESFPIGGLTVSCLAADHSVRCLSYRADLPRLRRFHPEQAEALDIPRPLWKRLQAGDSVSWDGGSAEPDDVLGPPRSGLRVAYITDTRPTAAMPAFVEDADLLICEATFGDPQDAGRAVERKHMLYREAAGLANAAGAHALWLTHFSPSIDDPMRWANEAFSRFDRTTVGKDGLQTTLRFRDDE